ncbi:MAG: helix-turn-helix domain-containing protein [Solirubrobacteraceae bacterium]
MPRKTTKPPRSAEHAALRQAIKDVIAENPGMTLETIAGDSGLDMKQVGDYSRGQGNPTFSSFRKLSKGLHVDSSELMRRVETLLNEAGSA